MAGDELDTLYSVQPDAFVAERTKLAKAAHGRGDEAAAKRISAARKPTAAAWIVNRLALAHQDAKQRLADLGDRLRAAHAALDGETIRELSAEQHRLINELAQAAFKAAGVKPSSSLRDDVTGTLQAAIADPDVGRRLGRLARPERFSGFGMLGEAASAPPPTRARGPAGGAPQRERLKAAVAAAERDKADADTALSERQAEREAARQRRDEAAALLRRAERESRSAEKEYDRAKQASAAAADAVKEAKAQLKRA